MAQMSTAERTAQNEAAMPRGAVAIIAPPRLPYHPAFEERFGVDQAAWRALVEAVFPAARTSEGVLLALSYCRARKLDPFKRPVHVVPIWDTAKGGYVESVWPGIGELRTTAFRTGQYAGCDPAEFGPDHTETFKGRIKKGNNWEEAAETITYPEWCQFTVYRLLRTGERVAIPGPRIYWLETYARRMPSAVPNDMWCKRSRGQLEKCAEAAALRRAFPEEVGNDLTSDEMAGQDAGTAAGTVIDHEEKAPPPRPKRGDYEERRAAPTTDLSGEAAVPAQHDGAGFDPATGEVVDEGPAEGAEDDWSEWLALRRNEADSYTDLPPIVEMEIHHKGTLEELGAPVAVRQEFAAIVVAAKKRVGGRR